jgi:hypothetical protein
LQLKATDQLATHANINYNAKDSLLLNYNIANSKEPSALQHIGKIPLKFKQWALAASFFTFWKCICVVTANNNVY